jgi:hypothetical protein
MIDPNLIAKIEDTINDASNSEQRTAVWRGKLNELDETEIKILVSADYDGNVGDFLIRVKQR